MNNYVILWLIIKLNHYLVSWIVPALVTASSFWWGLCSFSMTWSFFVYFLAGIVRYSCSSCVFVPTTALKSKHFCKEPCFLFLENDIWKPISQCVFIAIAVSLLLSPPSPSTNEGNILYVYTHAYRYFSISLAICIDIESQELILILLILIHCSLVCNFFVSPGSPYLQYLLTCSFLIYTWSTCRKATQYTC